MSGKKEHDDYIDPLVRIKARKRCTLVNVDHQSTKIQLCFLAVPDWHGSGLDAEFMYLHTKNALNVMPNIGPYAFHFPGYINNMYEDLAMCFQSIHQKIPEGQKAHLKIVPLGVGPNIRTRFGDNLIGLLLPAYLMALQYACNEFLDASWVSVIEFMDNTRGQLSPYITVKKVHIISGSQTNLFEFDSKDTVPIILAPCDAFCKIGYLDTDKNIATTIANATNLRTILYGAPSASETHVGPTYKEWPMST